MLDIDSIFRTMKAIATKDGLIFTLTEEVEVFYDKTQRKLKIIKNKTIVNEVEIDPKVYTISDLVNYLEKLEV